MINIAIFCKNYLVEKEIINALKKVTDVKVIAIETPDYTTQSQAAAICEILKQYTINVLFTINEHGMDVQTKHLDRFVVENAIIHVNWWVDDPFFTEIMYQIKSQPHSNRYDFVSDRGYLKLMQEKGFNAFFLPLATDPSIFFPDTTIKEYCQDVCFVGNSYRKYIEDYLVGFEPFMEQILPLVYKMLKKYSQNMMNDIENEIIVLLKSLDLPENLSLQKAAYLIKYFIGFLFRKTLVCNLVKRYDDFMVFGDPLWSQDIDRKKVSGKIGYYKNLNATYQQTKVNIDINRVIIKDGFTQRIFDCLASGSFIITSPKPVVYDFFETSGPGQDIVVFNNEKHLIELIDYYLDHPDEAKTIALRGQKRVLANHTYDHRIQAIFLLIYDNVK